MAKRVLIVSDISGTEIPEGEHSRVVFESEGRVIDVLASEAALLESQKLDLVTLTIHMPDGARRTVLMEATTLEKLWPGVDVETMLARAERFDQRAVPPSRRTPSALTAATTVPARAAVDRIDYSSPEHAGTPHRGRVSPEEAAYVRANLEAVNARLAAAGMRTIEPGTELAARFGL
jgi:hypothetical protein